MAGRAAKKIYYLLPSRKELSLSLVDNGSARILQARSQGYRAPLFRFWARIGDEFLLLRDWGPEPFCVLSAEHAGLQEFGVHVKAKGGHDLENQAWVKAAKGSSQ